MGMSEKMLKVKNGQSIGFEDLIILTYNEFSKVTLSLLEKVENHCVSYFAFPQNRDLQFIMAIANDVEGDIAILSHVLKPEEKKELDSLTRRNYALHIFEREIHENFGVEFAGHPWQKPVRFASDRFNKNLKINDYPFYSIKSEELHEVGVGPIHAGIIEPGHFRFICNGENVLHLEIQLGWQHRGLEQLITGKKKMLQRNILAENISGDSVIGHTIAFAQVMESLAGVEASEQVQIERALALELERIAIHTGDIGALCTDVAYSLGASVFGVLRTLIINFTQAWCGNRFGKGLIRTGGTNFPFTAELKTNLSGILTVYEKKFIEMSHITYRLPSVQNRFDYVGSITPKQARLIGSVGMAARMTEVKRDIRETHPFAGFKKFPYETITLNKGDVFARFLMRRKEIKSSISWIRDVLSNYNFGNSLEKPLRDPAFKPDRFVISLTEAWRGEVCHCAITDSSGNLIHYKMKDPSMHNWKSLELSLRNVEISDFPINNKSYNLSYCGHDL
jgi:Ni,Fe-hydrogenase III large subunit